jgi:hypothetical protein
MLGNTVLIEPEDYVQIQRDEKRRQELTAILAQYVRQRSRSSSKFEGPLRSITEDVVDDDKRQGLIKAVAELIDKMKTELERLAKPVPTEIKTASVPVVPRKPDRKDLFADEYWGIVPIRDDGDDQDS